MLWHIVDLSFEYFAVLGISSDDVDSHVEFLGKLDLPFRLLADEGGQTRQEYGVPKDLLGFLEGRQTYVIGRALSHFVWMLFHILVRKA